MKTDNLVAQRVGRAFLTEEACSLEEFRSLVERTTAQADWPHASSVERNIPVYDADRLARAAAQPDGRRAVLAELAELFGSGPGVAVFKGALADKAVVDHATDLFEGMIAEQHRSGAGGGDHFAKPGANDRVWNAAQKHCLADPANFALYYAAPAIALVSEAWLGPGWQMTAQVNRVNPGGAAQSPHRDYHLGFQSREGIRDYPAHLHALSPALTLQGAVAHCAMPVETGPTLFLPYSQSYAPGYLAAHLPEFRAYFEERHVQLPLETGDAVFFNPALFHAAGTNRTADVKRLANLLQVSSAFGRAMESLDRPAMLVALYPALRRLLQEGRLDEAGAARALACAAEGYSFPTNLDSDPPVGGLAPKTQGMLAAEALAQGWEPSRFATELATQEARRLP